MPLPVIGVSAEGIVVVTNQKTQGLRLNGLAISPGSQITDFFSPALEKRIQKALETGQAQEIYEQISANQINNVTVTPLSGMFRGKGVLLTIGTSEAVEKELISQAIDTTQECNNV